MNILELAMDTEVSETCIPNLKVVSLFGNVYYYVYLVYLLIHQFQQVADLLEARAVDGRGEPVPYLQAVFKGK